MHRACGPITIPFDRGDFRDCRPRHKAAYSILRLAGAIVVAAALIAPRWVLADHRPLTTSAQSNCWVADHVLALLRSSVRCDDATASLYYIAHENDVLHASNQDRLYTAGIRFENLIVIDDSIRKTRENVGFTGGFVVYTASGIGISEPEVNDRPYFGYSYLGYAYEKFLRGGSVGRAGVFNLQYEPYFRIEADVGLIGQNSKSGAIQTGIHDLLTVGSQTPQGWDNQIPNDLVIQLGGEWIPGGLAIVFDDRYRAIDFFPLLRLSNGIAFQNAEIELIMRADPTGRLKPFGINPSASSGAMDSATEITFHLFAKLRQRSVFHNASLQGGKSTGLSNNNKNRDIRPIVNDFEYGVNLTVYNVSIEFSVINRTQEIDEDNSVDEDGHFFGKIGVAVIRF